MADKEMRNGTQEQGTMAPAENGAAVVAPVKKEFIIVRGAKKFGGMVVGGAKKLVGAAKEHPLVASGLAFGLGVGGTMLVNHFFGGDSEIEDVIDVDAVEVETPEIPEVEVPEIPELPVEEVLEDLPEIPEVPSVEGIFDEI